MAPTTIVTRIDLCLLDIIFVLDESDSIDGADFATMSTFVQSMVETLSAISSLDVHYGLTLFNERVDTQVILDDDNSRNDDTFKNFVAGIIQAESGLTCIAGGMQAAFAANFGPLLADGTVDPLNTKLRAGANTVFFLITDGNPTIYPTDTDTCKVITGDCECQTTNTANGSKDIVSQIKKADVAPFKNWVFALGVGDVINTDFLINISDVYLSAANLDLATAGLVVNTVFNTIECFGDDSSTTPPTTPPTTARTTAPTTECEIEADIMFLLDESSSIDAQEFASMVTFINNIVTDIENDFKTPETTFRYGLTLFSERVRTPVFVGNHQTSSSGPQFLSFLNDIEQASSGLTCTAGGLQAVFGANYRTTDANGLLQDDVTHLRKNVQSVIFLITDGQPTIRPGNPTVCAGGDGDCQCMSTNMAVNSASIYDLIKVANTQEYPNRIVALGVGDDVNSEFLDSISDDFFNADEFSAPALEEVREFIKDALTCPDGDSPSPTSAPTPSSSTVTSGNSVTNPPTSKPTVGWI